MVQGNSVQSNQNNPDPRAPKGGAAKKDAQAQQKLLRPSQKVAALLILLGAETATEVLKHITDPNILEQITLDIILLI